MVQDQRILDPLQQALDLKDVGVGVAIREQSDVARLAEPFMHPVAEKVALVGVHEVKIRTVEIAVLGEHFATKLDEAPEVTLEFCVFEVLIVEGQAVEVERVDVGVAA